MIKEEFNKRGQESKNMLLKGLKTISSSLVGNIADITKGVAGTLLQNLLGISLNKGKIA